MDSLRSEPIGGDSASTLDPAKLAAYRHAFDELPAQEQHACIARLNRGNSYEQIALDLGDVSVEEARVTVSRGMDRLLREVFGGTAHRSERLSDLLGSDGPTAGSRQGDGAPADMSSEEEALLRELILLAKTEPPLETWGKFTNLQVLGSGGFGVVHSAWDPVLETRVALKLYHPHRSQRPKEELLGEARKLARVTHPNVVKVRDADEIDGQVGVWMELIDGKTLEKEVSESGPLDAAAATDVGIKLCAALAAVHAAGIVHGDIKAQNVMRGRDKEPIVMDFGAARFQDPTTAESNETRAGTPAYMAPELFKLRGGQLVEPTFQSDVYAVGVLLFFLVTGKFPVKGRDAEDIHLAHQKGERMRLLAEEKPDLPADFARVIEQALARTPEQRWLTVATMRDALQASSPAEESPVTAKRLIRGAGGVAAAALASMALGFGSTRLLEVALHIDPEFTPSTPGYLLTGAQALIPFIANWGVIGFVLGVVMFLAYASRRLLGARLPGFSGRVNSALQSVDPKTAAAGVFLVGVGSWVAITWTYSEVWTVADGLRLGTTTDYSLLGPDGSPFNIAYGRDSARLSFVLALVVWLWFPRLEHRVSDVTQVRLLKWATLAVAFIAIASVAMLYQLVWQSYVVVQLPDRQAYVVAQTDEELLLFSPRSTEDRYRRIRRDDNSFNTLEARRLFDNRGDDTRRSVP